MSNWNMGDDARTWVTARFDARAGTYDRESLWVDDPAMCAALLDGLPAGATVLDVATGTGAIASRAMEHGHWTAGADISLRMLLHARARGCAVVCADFHSLPFATAAFSAVVVRQALQYADLHRALVALAEVGRDEVRLGQIVASSTEDRARWRAVFGIIGQRSREVFAPGDLGRAVVEAGLVVRSVVTLEGKDRLLGPNLVNVLTKADFAAIETLMREIDPNASRVQGDWIHRVTWEFITVECPRGQHCMARRGA